MHFWQVKEKEIFLWLTDILENGNSEHGIQRRRRCSLLKIFEEPDTAEDAPKTIYGGLIDGVLHIKDYKTDPPTEYVFQQSTNWYDREQYEIYEGDIVEVDGKYYQVIWDDITSGYLFLGDDMETSPGGAYLTER